MSSDGRGRRRSLIVSVIDGMGRPLAGRGLARWLSTVAPREAHGAVAIALVDDRRIRALNRAYRHRDAATDVLSFSYGASGRTSSFLGDIVIATGVARRQAREHRHSYEEEIRTLALHGLLHLLGYDHERDTGEMRRLEDRLRARGGLTRGLIDRERGSA
jgi:probable rRNA maturation factor